MYYKTVPSLIFVVLLLPVSLIYLLQIMDENNVLQDGTLIDLCGATLLWRSAAGLTASPVSMDNPIALSLAKTP